MKESAGNNNAVVQISEAINLKTIYQFHNRNTNSSIVWSAIHRIRGRTPTKPPILQIDNRCIATIPDIANAFATAFEAVSIETNYPKEFLSVKHNA